MYQVKLGLLEADDVAAFFADAFGQSGMRVADAEAREMARLAKGSPFLVQLLGYHVWQLMFEGGRDLAGPDDVRAAFDKALPAYMASVVVPSLHDLSEDELRRLVRYAPEFAGERPANPEDFVNITVAHLLEKGVLEEPVTNDLRLTVPYMARYLAENATQLRRYLEG